jgi:hypothetical protein
MALIVTQQEATRSEQARTEVRTVMTAGAVLPSLFQVVAPIMTAGQYDATGSPTADFNEAIALAVIRAVARLPVVLPSYAKAALPSAVDNARALIYVTDEAGGEVPAFSDGTNWRRVTDRAVVS